MAMMINETLAKARPFIEQTYDKTMRIYGNQTYLKPNGATGGRFDIVDTVPCRLSVVSLKNTNQSEANALQTVHKVFCSPTTTILAGSKVVVDDIKYEASEDPMIYVTHLEVYLNRQEWV